MLSISKKMYGMKIKQIFFLEKKIYFLLIKNRPCWDYPIHNPDGRLNPNRDVTKGFNKK